MTYREILPIWWCFIWRSLLLGLAAGALTWLAAGFAMTLIGMAEASATAASVVGYSAGLLASLWAFRFALNKHRLTFD